ncbi:MAG TPA: TIGR03067 domain-containing protein, partial [Planctomycetaceae bacterium]
MLKLPDERRNGIGRGLAGTPDLSLVASGQQTPWGGFGPHDAYAIVWDVHSGNVLGSVIHKDAMQLHCVALSADGKRLATGSQQAGTCVFEVSTGKLLLTLPNLNPGRKHPDPQVSETGANQVLCLAFSPDGRFLAIGDMLGVKLVDAKSGELVHNLDKPFRFGRSGLVFSKDSRLLARIATDKVVPIWSAQTGKLLTELPTEAHGGAFSEDGRSFAVGFTDAKAGVAVWPLRDDLTAAAGKSGPEFELWSDSIWNLRDEEVEQFVLDTLVRPYQPDPRFLSGQLDAFKAQITGSWAVVRQQDRVVQTLLKAVKGTAKCGMIQRRLALGYLGGAVPREVLPLLIYRVRGAESQPKWDFPFNEVEVLGGMRGDAREAIPALIELLEHADSSVRQEVILALVKIGPSSSEVMNALAENFDHSRAVYEVGRYGKMARPLGPKFEKLLDSQDAEIRTWAAWALVTSGYDEPRGYKTLLEYVVAGTTENRGLAATALAALGSRARSMIPKLRTYENDPDERVARVVRDAIRRIEKDERIFTHAEEAAKVDTERKAAAVALANLRAQLKEPNEGAESKPVPLEFRFAANPADSILQPRVPADFEKRHYPDNSAKGRAAAKDNGFIWIKLAHPKDGKVSLPLEGTHADSRFALLADTPEHSLPWDGKWSVEECRVVRDPLGDENFGVELKLNEAGGAALRALTKSHLNQPLAIIVDGEIIAAPIVRSEIGRAVAITGKFNREQADKLAKALRVQPVQPAQADYPLRGRVVDADGKPVANSNVRLFQSLDNRPGSNQPGSLPVFHSETKSNDAGVFELTVPRTAIQATIWATADGKGIAARPAAMRVPPPDSEGLPDETVPQDSPDRFVLRLSTAVNEFRVVDPQRKPLAGAKVMVRELVAFHSPYDIPKRVAQLAKKRGLPASLMRHILLEEYGQIVVVPREMQALLSQGTNAEGLARIAGAGPGDVARLEVETEAFGRQFIRAEQIDHGENEPAEVWLNAVGRVEGRIEVDERAAAAGFKIDGLRLKWHTENIFAAQRESLPRPNTGSAAECVVGVDGRFVIPMIGSGTLHLDEPLKADSPVKLLLQNRNHVPANAATTVLVTAIHGVLAKGRVRLRDTGRGVPHASLEIVQTAGGRAGAERLQQVQTDEAGNYQAYLLPGPNLVRLQTPIAGYATVHAWEQKHAQAQSGLHVVVDQSAPEFRLPTFDLEPLRSRTAKVVDAKGLAAAAYWMIDGYPSDSRFPSTHAAVKDEGEVKFEFPVSYPPASFSAQADPTKVVQKGPLTLGSKYVVNVLQDDPLTLQITTEPWPNRAARDAANSNSPATPDDRAKSMPELKALRQERVKANDRAAAEKLVGVWTMTLPRGAVHSVELTPRPDGTLLLDSKANINSRGAYAFSKGELSLIEPVQSNMHDLVFTQNEDGSFTLTHEEHDTGGNYLGAILRRAEVKPGHATPDKTKADDPKPDDTNSAAAKKMEFRLRVRRSDGSPAQFNGVVTAHVGLPKSPPQDWIGSPDREGVVSLAGLPAGTHWLLVDGQSEQRTLIQVTLPSKQPVIERRLRSGTAWNSRNKNIDVQVKVENKNENGEIVVMEIVNRTNEALRVSEGDVQLETEIPRDSKHGTHGELMRGLSPHWPRVDEKPFEEIRIESGRSGQLRLRWREWLAAGLWSSRDIDVMIGPGLPEPEPGKRWVRAWLGNIGAVPAYVTVAVADRVNQTPASDATTNQGAGVGTLSGRFVYDGEPSVPQDLQPWLSKLEADSDLPRDSDGRVSGVASTYRGFLQEKIRPNTHDQTLLVGQDRGIANVVVWAESKNIPWTPPKDGEQPPVTIRLQGGNYSPRITPLTVGQPLLVENHDPVPFNFHVDFLRNQEINVMLAARSVAPARRWTFSKEEKLPTRYRSDQGTWADGWVFIRNNPYVAVSDKNGFFKIPNVPPGEWEFRVWHERKGFVQHWPKGLFKQVIKPGENSLGTVKLKPEVFGEKPVAKGLEPFPGDRPDEPIDREKELAALRGTWTFVNVMTKTWPKPIGVKNDRVNERRWVVKGNEISWTGLDGDEVRVGFTIDPRQAPRHIDFTFLTGPSKGEKCLGVYEWRGERGIDICIADPGSHADRPKEIFFSGTAPYSWITLDLLAAPEAAESKPKSPDGPIAKELEPFQGTWPMDICDTENQTLYAPQKVANTWRWVITGNKIAWTRSAGEVWHLTFSVDPTKSPKEIDLTYLDGPFKGQTCLGLYEWGGVNKKMLQMSVQDPGAKVARPKSISMKSGGQTSL